MPRGNQPEQRFPSRLTEAQRNAVAELVPQLSDRLKLDEPNSRVIDFTLTELRELATRAQTALQQARGPKRPPLLHIRDHAARLLSQPPEIAAIPASARVYQFKITLIGTSPSIWRRIQVKDGTFDRLHEHIQTAMGWTNSHLHHFRIGEQEYGDPLLMAENFVEFGYKDSTTTRLSAVLPADGKKQFRFEYEYDFGDCWRHEVVFEGIVRAEPGRRYPLCLEGARACPPEDVGGIPGYADFLDAIRDRRHERHRELLDWVGGSFRPATFNAEVATQRMHRGLPDWRRWV